MLDSVDSNFVRIVGYVVVAGLALAARRRERADAGTVDGVWRPFWWMTAAFLLALAIGRAGDVGALVSDLGRAVDSPWYGARRPIQAIAVGAVGLVWFVGVVAVVVACWRTPERRRRYLPMFVVVVTLAAFAAIRFVSLHQVDTILYRRELASVHVGTAIECLLLVAAGAVTMWSPRGSSGADSALDPSGRRVDAVDVAAPGNADTAGSEPVRGS